ncbi:hypothetical protein [Ottowia sp.]|uniref:hypothetical protein n=1 Tax=Ottowia sp. TaxID=1898956 RepID=UPI002C56F4F5|nr:hypothetical protein [Ottowia sp.]HOB67689.1 hypothetical protein [Ottowia sp.]HPZ57506.1 hypothetical protein [Ottowia sp.]HQD48158.1 hypothetical protein [Ottowia sp.]
MNPSSSTARPATPSPDPEVTIELGDVRHAPSDTLPHERDQQTANQAPAAGQDQTRRARKAHDDAQRGRPDTSAAPLLQQPSPAQQRPPRP